MGSVRIVIIIIVAAAAAIGLALIVRSLAGGNKVPVPAQVLAAAPVVKPMSQVLVASRDLPLGTTLAEGDLAWQEWPVEAVNPTFIVNSLKTNATIEVPKDDPAAAAGKVAKSAAIKAGNAVVGASQMEGLYGSVVKESILAKEPVVLRKLVRDGEGGYMSVVLQPGTRAVAVPVTVETGAGGFVLPGDRVDILANRQTEIPAPAGGVKTVMVSSTLFRNIKVLAIDQTTTVAKNTQAAIGASATLQIPSNDVEFLLQSKAQGDLFLVLRPYAEAGGASGRVSGLARNGQPGRSVRMIKNGVASDVAVSQ
jgi:pilus assembly protein CpaB